MKNMKTFSFGSLVITLSAVVISSCANVPLEEREYEIARRAISSNNSEKLKQILNSKEKMSVQFDCLLSETTKYIAKDKICREDIVKTLLDYGAVPAELDRYNYDKSARHTRDSMTCHQEKDLSSVIGANCVETAKLVMSKMSTNEIVNGLRYTHYIPGEEFWPSHPDFSASKERRLKGLETVALMKTTLKPLCEKDGEASAVCDLLEKVEDEESREQKFTVEMRERRNAALKAERDASGSPESPEEILAMACDYKGQIEIGKGMIKHEKKIGSVAGFVDAKILRQGSSYVLEGQSQINRLSKLYRAKTGKSLALSDCKSRRTVD